MAKKNQHLLPDAPGIYIFKDKNDNILYIGKALSLKNRVQSYFCNVPLDWKLRSLLSEYDHIDFIVTHSEENALRLEVDLIQKYKPKYNVLLKTGQPFLYILFIKGTEKKLPEILLVRTKTKRGSYYGPFVVKHRARKAYRYLTETFRLIPCLKKIAGGCLKYHLGLCPGTCKPDFDRTDYEFRMNLAEDVLQENRKKFAKKIQEKIKIFNKELLFEKAKKLHEYLTHMETIFSTIQAYKNQEFYAADLVTATTPSPYQSSDPEMLAYALKDFFYSEKPIYTIDCFDVSHFQSKSIVGSCIRFTYGKPQPSFFRRFAIQSIAYQNDYAALQEIVQRRYRDTQDIPDLVFIDGGKGQLNAVLSTMPDIHCASLAKKEEIVYSTKIPQGVPLDIHTPVGKLLIALRDYAHHFAVTYHRLKRNKSL